MQLSDEQKTAMTTLGIPDYMHGAIIRYYEKGYLPGSFLTALINNDLKETFANADDTNAQCIRNYVMWFYNYAPGGSWGHSNAVQGWVEHINAERAKEKVSESISD